MKFLTMYMGNELKLIVDRLLHYD